jgi:mutator protein MutT
MFYVTTTLHGKRILVPKESLLPRKAVYALIVSEENILLVNIKSTDKLWFPGGKVDDGESDEEALLRECREEVGLNVVIEKLLLETEATFYYETTHEGFLQFAKFYVCKVSTETLKEHVENVPGDEAETPKWFRINDLHEDQFQDYGFQVLEFLKNSSSR